MKKTLYSLTLSDEVVREIDLLAHRRGMSRSGLINEILAEYVQVMTPQRWVSEGNWCRFLCRTHPACL